MEERPTEHEPGTERAAAPSGDGGGPSAADLAERAHQALAGIVSLMGYDAVVTNEGLDGQTAELAITGPDAPALVGKHGATLDALQLLVAVMANRGIIDGLRVSIDADGYRERRRQLLEKMARAHAEQAKDTGKEIVITDLKAHERRIVHLTLKDDPDVETYSEGLGDERQLVISPRSGTLPGDGE
jgi:spoIIIJ-associated protein